MKSNTEVKELNSWSIGWNEFEPNSTFLSLYNWDDATEDETDTVVIHLSDKDVQDLAKCLNMILKGE